MHQQLMKWRSLKLAVGAEFNSRDIILHHINGDVQQVSETHRSYDGLQYPSLLWQGEDTNYFNIKLRNPQTDEETNKKINATIHID